MENRPALSKGEMEVVRKVWELGTATVREVHESFPIERGLDFATVQTYLRRLEAKGYLTGVLEGRIRKYSPRVRPRTVIRETVNDLVDRLFGGESMPLMRHLIEDERLSAEDIQRLRTLLDDLDRATLSDSGSAP